METSRILLSFLLSCAAAAQAQAQFQYTADNGKITITRYDCSDAAVIIPDTINGLPVTTIGNFSFWGCTHLTSVIVPNSVTTIGAGAFWICTSLSSVVIGESVATIGENAFGECTDLASITLPDSVTTIGSSAFASCSRLTSVIVPNNVATIGVGAFRGCTGLTRATIGKRVTSVGDATFRNCVNLTGIEVDAGSPSYCSLEGVLFSKNQEILVQYPAGKAGSYVIPNSVTAIGVQAFSGCTLLTSVTIPASVNAIGDAAFSDCTNLTSLYFEGDRPFVDRENPVTGSPFANSPAVIVYFRAENTGWERMFENRPTAVWRTPPLYADWLGSTDLLLRYPEAATESDDPDHDNLDNYHEMLAGTDPTDPSSVLVVERDPRPDDLPLEVLLFSRILPMRADEHVVYSRSVPGKTFGVQWADSLSGPWHINRVATATTTQMCFVFEKPMSQRFYRVILAQ